MRDTVNVGLLGWGTVGNGVVKIFRDSEDLLARRAGVGLRLKRVADLDLERDRGVTLPPEVLTKSARDVIRDPDIHIVVELIGGEEPARTFILEALRAGKHVVTANKALLAKHWDELHGAARRASRDLYFEASVGGGIPVVQALNDGLAANHIQAIYAIINGTANYILTEMGKGAGYAETLALAKQAGYAEADPALDVEGGDTMHKLVILASLAFGRRVKPEQVYVEGINRLTAADLEYAREEFDHVVKLLGIARQNGDGSVQVRVHPTLIPREHLLAAVNGVYNGIYTVGDAVGATLAYGQGAGEMPTASAVLSDIVFIARNIHMGVAGNVPSVYYLPGGPDQVLNVAPMGDLVTEYYLRLTVQDRMGVIAQIAKVLGEHRISIASFVQKEGQQYGEEGVTIVIMTHKAREDAVRAAVDVIDRMDFIKQPTFMLRVEALSCRIKD